MASRVGNSRSLTTGEIALFIKSMETRQEPRTLSFDERLAAEAAFAGRPFNPKWSKAARAVYDGMLHAMGDSLDTPETVPAVITQQDDPEGTRNLSSEAPLLITSDSPDVRFRPETMEGDAAPSDQEDTDVMLSRERAIEAGGLIEVTPLAKSLGVPYAVGMTRPAWETIVTASDSIPPAAHEGRLRDILVALRLRLMSGPVNRSVIDFPALLTFPPDSVPQPQLLLAAFHDSPSAPTCITLLLPRELSLLLDGRGEP